MAPSARDAQSNSEIRRRDLELARAVTAGDEGARREVAGRLYERVLCTVRYLRGERPDTPDLVQSCLLELLRAMGSFRGESSLETWADRIAVRTTMRELRRAQRQREVVADAPAERPAVAGDPEQILGQEQLQRHVGQMLQKLPAERRLVMVLRAVYGYTMPEIAELTDAQLYNVQNDYRAARKQLRRLVETDVHLREWAGGRTS
jgi:RNA polymerase sigma factor (sigma-70 family)